MKKIGKGLVIVLFAFVALGLMTGANAQTAPSKAQTEKDEFVKNMQAKSADLKSRVKDAEAKIDKAEAKQKSAL